MKAKIRSVARLAWPYVIMILLPIISVAILSTYILSNHTEQLVTDQSSTLEVAAQRVDQNITSVTDLSYLLAENGNLFTYVINGMTGVENDYFAYDEIEDLFSGVAQNTNIAEIYFYDANTGRIIASHTSLSDAAMFFRYRYRFSDRTPEEAVQRLREYKWGYSYSPAAEVMVNNRPMEVLEYRLSVPIDRLGDHQSQLIISLDVQALFQDFFDALHDGAEFYIYDSNSLVYSSGTTYAEFSDADLSGKLEKQKLGSRKLYAMELPINNGLWRVQLFYPEVAGTDRGQSIMSSLLPAIILPVLLSICICIYFTHKNHRDITEILMLLRGEAAPEEEWEEPRYLSHELIRSYAGQMVEKNSAYRTKLREFRVSHKDSVLERLVRNAYHSRAEKQKALSEFELQVGDEACAALCIQFDDICNDFFTVNNITIRELVADLLRTHTGRNMEVFGNLPTEIVCILAVDETFKSAAEEIISLLNVQITYQYGIDLRIGIGNPVASIFDIHHSYEQAKEVIRYGESAGKNIRIYGQMDTLDEVVFYPVLTDDKISNYMIAGRAEDAKDVIVNIYTENFRDNTKMLSLEAIALVKYRITNAVTSVAEKQGISILGDTKKFLTEKNVKKYFVALTHLVDVIVEEIMTKKNNAQNVLAVKVRDYIQDHYMDCGLSIKQIAGSFHFHENYISNIYKEEYGENLSNAIEQLRIDKACELLSTTDIRIGEVASAVGYSSDSSFRRAFKKITGVSPVDYRSTHTAELE